MQGDRVAGSADLRRLALMTRLHQSPVPIHLNDAYALAVASGKHAGLFVPYHGGASYLTTSGLTEMAYHGDRRTDIFWRDVMPLWPLRLLHIPTMTSLQRVGESTYGEFQSPQ